MLYCRNYGIAHDWDSSDLSRFCSRQCAVFDKSFCMTVECMCKIFAARFNQIDTIKDKSPRSRALLVVSLKYTVLSIHSSFSLCFAVLHEWLKTHIFQFEVGSFCYYAIWTVVACIYTSATILVYHIYIYVLHTLSKSFIFSVDGNDDWTTRALAYILYSHIVCNFATIISIGHETKII